MSAYATEYPVMPACTPLTIRPLRSGGYVLLSGPRYDGDADAPFLACSTPQEALKHLAALLLGPDAVVIISDKSVFPPKPAKWDAKLDASPDGA